MWNDCPPSSKSAWDKVNGFTAGYAISSYLRNLSPGESAGSLSM
jgi:hypothetical protein